MSIGIGAIHCLLPQDRVSVTDLPEFAGQQDVEPGSADISGVRTVSVSTDDSACDLAVRACRELLAAHPGEPDLMIQIASRPAEALPGSDAHRIHNRVGLTSAFPFTVGGLGCAGASVAAALARDLLLADPARHSVLLAYGSRPADGDRVRYPVAVVGDGAFAMTIARGGRPVLKAHRMQADGIFNDLYRVDHKRAPGQEWSEENALKGGYFELATQSRTRMSALVDETLSDAGLTKDDIAATLMPNVTASAYQFYEQALGLPIHPVCGKHLAEVGHLGPIDVILNLHRLPAEGDLSSADHVLVLSNARYATWAVTLWEV
ncbi:3-oxoacyl-[acyl-carrier-protein] synthase III C-terminal domain-containing protein [Streptomyces sp. NBC_01477]|uniref:3-oxoacyl-[acyl-carrier-protein] synthase III C-terminal domain-containing protein n=1 Tax=Streptomyces sp. NBC_01477 TaxID=2976015 RepID=UPI002E30DC7F|nr:3-oxoacyl-[acyl-carrier-protein] synthase III C-terminal domain-containing protein [Streptomyces sp. NBC_01477]